jgi:hypothetical protein
MDTLCTTDRLCVCGALSRDQHIFQFITKNWNFDILGGTKYNTQGKDLEFSNGVVMSWNSISSK